MEMACFNQVLLWSVQNSGALSDNLSAELENVILGLLSDKISEETAKSRINKLHLQRSLINDDRRKLVFSLANKTYLSGRQQFAAFLIASVHHRATGRRLETLRDNFHYAFSLFLGTPYNHGYVRADGKIISETPAKNDQRAEPDQADSGPGLNCIRMNNIFSNLLIGARGYTPDVGSTDEDIFKKRELTREGIYSFPVIVKYPGEKLDRMDSLLRSYGDFFAVQMYSATSGRPLHTLFVHREDNSYIVLDTLAPGPGFGRVGDLAGLGQRLGNKMTFTFNLVDTNSARPVRQAKSREFLLNLKAAVKQAKEAYSTWKQR